MKLPALFAGLVLVATPLAALADGSYDGQCTDATIAGHYAFRVSGQAYLPTAPGASTSAWVDREGIAMARFDGQGGMSQVDWVMSNGVPLGGHVDTVSGFHDQETGTYTVNPDCTGSAEIDLPGLGGPGTGPVIRVYFVLAERGRVMHMIVRQLILPGQTTSVPVAIHSDGERVGGFDD